MTLPFTPSYARYVGRRVVQLPLVLVLCAALVTACHRTQPRPTWQQLLPQADAIAQQAAPVRALTKVEYRLLYGQADRWSYQYSYVSPTVPSIRVDMSASNVQRPRVSTFQESLELSNAAFAEWQRCETLLRRISDDPDQIIALTKPDALKKDATLRISTVALSADPTWQKQYHTEVLWLVTYLSDQKVQSLVYFVDAHTHTIVHVWEP